MKRVDQYELSGSTRMNLSISLPALRHSGWESKRMPALRHNSSAPLSLVMMGNTSPVLMSVKRSPYL